jgi:DNA replication protein DnaC
LPESRPNGERLRNGIPPSRAGNTFESFEVARNPQMAAALEQVQAVSNGTAWCAFLVGLPGNGKTHLAVAALKGREHGMFWKVPDFLAWLRGKLSAGIEAGYGGEGVERIIVTYQAADFLLVLDDLGTENPTDWAHEQLYRVLDNRYEERAPTIVTSNVKDVGQIDARIRSRFREGLVICDGKDLR